MRVKLLIVNYCKLFKELLKRDISPIVLRLLLYMYTSQTLRVKCGHTVSNCFTVRNGIKQGGVLSPLLFAIYTDNILKKLEESGVGCHMSCSGDNCRELLDGQGTLNLELCLLSWKYNLTNLRKYMYKFNELIDIGDGIKECNSFTKVEISRSILNIFTR